MWLNPYRGGIQTNYDGLAPNHVCNTLREYCYVYDKYLWLDPGAPEVADQLISVIEDIVTRYDPMMTLPIYILCSRLPY